MEDNEQEPPTDSPPALSPPPQPSAWSQRKGKGLFWILLFAPAVMCLIALAIMVSMSAKGPEALGLVIVPAFGICVYCGYWLASGFAMSTAGKVFATIGLALGFALLNSFVFFAGCFAVLMVTA